MLLLLLLLAVFTTGVALTLSAANVFYHDVNYLWGILVPDPVLRHAGHLRTRPTVDDRRALDMHRQHGPTGSFIIAVAQRDVRPAMPGLGRDGAT